MPVLYKGENLFKGLKSLGKSAGTVVKKLFANSSSGELFPAFYKGGQYPLDIGVKR